LRHENDEDKFLRLPEIIEDNKIDENNFFSSGINLFKGALTTPDTVKD